MSLSEIAIIVGCLIAGYWAVNKYLEDKDVHVSQGFQEGQKNKADNFGGAKNSSGDAASDSDFIMNNWANILGVEESASALELSVAYKSMMRQYHPDKCASLGPELRDLAELKTKQINAAYDYAQSLKS